MANTWVLVADSARARLFQIGKGMPAMTEVACYSNSESRSSAHDSVAERLPRTFDSMGFSRHSIEPHTPLREKNAQHFAQLLGEVLKQGQIASRYDQLVLVAPPRFLGALHKRLDKALHECVVKEIAHDLVASTPSEILSYLPQNLHA